MPEDITLVAAGMLAALGSISIWGAILAGMFGVLAGDAFLYTLGRVYGRKAFELPLIRTVMTPKRVAMAERKIRRNSVFICFTARFLPGLRSPVFLLSGIMGVRPIIFYGLDGLAALISVPVWIFVGHWVGENIDYAFQVIERVQLGLAAAVITGILLYIVIRRYRRNQRASRLSRFMRRNQEPQRKPK